MKKTDAILRLVRQEIENKDVLEVACGTAEFSLSAAQCARQVACIDIDSSRLNGLVETRENIRFRKMDAAEMEFGSDTFDTVILYNALCHIESRYDAIMAECRRVLKPEGRILLIATWKMDGSLMAEMFGDRVERLEGCYMVKLGKSNTPLQATGYQACNAAEQKVSFGHFGI